MRRDRREQPRCGGREHGRANLTLHPPERLHREQEWVSLFHAATAGPPATAA
jgi:hypothetical protein